MSALSFPVSEVQLKQQHSSSQSQLESKFKADAMGNDVEKELQGIQAEVSREYNKIVERNYQASEKVCLRIAKDLFSEMHKQNRSADWVRTEFDRRCNNCGPAKQDVFAKVIARHTERTIYSTFTSAINVLSNKVQTAITKLSKDRESLVRSMIAQSRVEQQIQQATQDLTALQISQNGIQQQTQEEITRISIKTEAERQKYAEKAQALNIRLRAAAAL